MSNKTIWGIPTQYILRPNTPNAYIDSKGRLVENLTGAKFKGRPKKGTTKVLMGADKVSNEIEKRKNKALELELGGQKYADLTKQEKAKLKEFGWTKRDIKVISLSQDAEMKSKREKWQPKLTYEMILTKFDYKTGKRVPRVKRRDKESGLYSGKEYAKRQKDILTGKRYSDKDAIYKQNWLDALNSGKLYLSSKQQKFIKDFLNNGGDVNDLPELYETYAGFEIGEMSVNEETGEVTKKYNENYNIDVSRQLDVIENSSNPNEDLEELNQLIKRENNPRKRAVAKHILKLETAILNHNKEDALKAYDEAVKYDDKLKKDKKNIRVFDFKGHSKKRYLKRILAL